MTENPRIGTASGKPYMRVNGTLVSERRGDEMSVGMTKFYRVTCFQAIGGFVREVMWDAIDCHKARQLGWTAISWDEPDLNFEHLRPMGSSQAGIHTGRRRHGFGQYYMGSYFPVFPGHLHLPHARAALCHRRAVDALGLSKAWAKREDQHGDAELRRFIRAYQRRALMVGRTRAVAEIEAERASLFTG
jgi:biofilm PGA synthesis N-glycosyltransferase PgaC